MKCFVVADALLIFGLIVLVFMTWWDMRTTSMETFTRLPCHIERSTIHKQLQPSLTSVACVSIRTRIYVIL